MVMVTMMVELFLVAGELNRVLNDIVRAITVDQNRSILAISL